MSRRRRGRDPMFGGAPSFFRVVLFWLLIVIVCVVVVETFSPVSYIGKLREKWELAGQR